MTKDEALRMALEALEEISTLYMSLPKKGCMALAAIEEVLAQPERPAVQGEPEPIQFKCTVVDDDHSDGVPLSKWGRHPDQEPFCYHDGRNIVGKEFADHSDVFPLYTSPKPAVPKRKPLTDEQKLALCKQFPDHLTFNAINAIEAAHGIKGDA